MKRSLVYARVSSDKQAERTSIDKQIARCEDYAAEHGLEIVRVFTEDFSGAFEQRPAFDELRATLERGEAEAVIWWEINRLFRDDVDMLIRLREWAWNDVEMHDTELGPITERNWEEVKRKGQDSYNYVRTLSENTKAGKDDKIRRVGRPVLGGIVPYGYRKVGRRWEAELEIDEEKAEYVKLMYKLYTRGNGGDPMSLRALSTHLMQIGAPLPSKRGKEWIPSTVARILQNPLYRGQYTFGRKRNERKPFRLKGKPKKVSKDQWLMLDMPELRLVSDEVWYEAQNRFKANKQMQKHAKNSYLLGGLIECGGCGYRFSGETKKRTHTTTAYYRHTRKERLKNGCGYGDKVYIRADIADSAVWGMVRAFAGDPWHVQVAVKELREHSDEELSEVRQRLETLDNLIEEVEEELESYIAELPNHSNEKAIQLFRQRINELTARLDALEAERIQLEHTFAQQDFTPEQQDYLLEYAEKIKKGLEIAQNSPDTMRRALETLRLSIVYHQEGDALWLELRSPITFFEGTELPMS